MTYFMRSGNNFNVTANEALDIHEELPVGTYTVKYDDFNGRFYLQMVTGYDVSQKIYGDTRQTADRILETFNQRSNSTGVMLTGEKGSGKTMLAKILSNEGEKRGYPTILINEPWCGEEFNAFMQKIDQPTVVIFDEFEKVYSADDQEKMLTLLDGVYPSKKLYILTCNNQYRVNEHMRNRPGRIYYRLDYAGLDRDFIIEYCEDNLKNLSHVESICRLAVMFSAFNFDILKAMVEEMNRYDETPQQVMKFLNASPEYSDRSTYDVELAVNGTVLTRDAVHTNTWEGNPLDPSKRITVAHWGPDKDEDGDPKYYSHQLSMEDLESVDSAAGKFFFRRGTLRVALKRKVTVAYDYSAF